MSSAARGLTEPHVLAYAKRRLFPDDEGYAVVDTQFATDQWLADVSIDADVREALAPFNHVHVGSGYPDLVGARVLDADMLAVERFGDTPPLVVVEAKGYTQRGGVDVERGVVQAYDRLHEANAAYVAAPVEAVSQSARTLARELNVGVLGVAGDGDVQPMEVPRLVGTHTTSETDAVQLRAGPQALTDRSFGLNHPKNYLGYPLAVAHPADTAAVLSERVVGAVDSARKGAVSLGLIESHPAGDRLTQLGREVVRFARREYGSVDAALDAFDDWKGSPTRFCDLAPRWGLLARQVVLSHPATQLLVEELQHLHEDRVREPTLVEFVTYLHELHPSFTVELFLRGNDDVRSRLLTEDGDLRTGELTDGNVYHSPTVFQLKAMCYHKGILTERGAEPSNLDPTTDVWALREPV
ncbi:hypothetical protein SAMN04487949_2435 [Halogranum gelatinilyticum]|uniref:Restriction endonuclease n=1 Tax=Halogranum gelatinilyticum TaxID=660521 RepID=A0A1G9VMT3_9EURY|nr:hypothetical protein [Halogranum gelatinilyticum]SDM73383.1 hypothetical protein SAMN04487949_2435 [Halogranum gelatinilyticum]